MRRFISTVLVTLTVVIGTLSLGGCIVPVHERGRVVVHDDSGHHHNDRDRDRDRDRDHDRDRNH